MVSEEERVVIARIRLPPPADVTEALRKLKRLQKTECLALGIPWSDDRLIAVHEDGTPVRPEWYSDEFHRLRRRLGLRRIHLKGLRNTSVTLMLARGIHPHTVATWHGHDPAVSHTVYNNPQPEDLRAAGTTLFSATPRPRIQRWHTVGTLNDVQEKSRNQQTPPDAGQEGFSPSG
ncbi:hypothetical protein NDR87_33875 [Nocardia sp. CDC159]|uniref:Phage integrase family protein n=1 Tax=Nocardia pulmonis TaxID=2951408 RepID=A0A9X2EI63_9NOCA|nr:MULTISPECIES: hypothetical protein [Nocardia]MCM6778486.1 hypothetical protein [Nocardia pulmonis]MCM6791375.1 hypothetical protein [Nocardia sp. CDC159]